MIRTPALVEIHYAVWAVLAIPLGLAGTFFLMPGLLFVQAGILLTAAGLLIFYIAWLTRGDRRPWMIGVLLHLAGLAAAAYYLPRWESWLGIPFALANFYSLAVLLIYRKYWTGAAAATLVDARPRSPNPQH